MRKLDMDQLRFWVMRYKTKSAAISFLETKTGIGFYTLRRILQGRRSPETIAEQDALCKATGLNMDTLFPVVENKKESA